MNKLLHKVLLAGDIFMPEMHLAQSIFTYNTCESLLKTKK